MPKCKLAMAMILIFVLKSADQKLYISVTWSMVICISKETYVDIYAHKNICCLVFKMQHESKLKYKWRFNWSKCVTQADSCDSLWQTQ